MVSCRFFFKKITNTSTVSYSPLHSDLETGTVCLGFHRRQGSLDKVLLIGYVDCHRFLVRGFATVGLLLRDVSVLVL